MDGLPDSLMSRFHLYLNVLPIVDEIGQILLLVTGIVLFLVSIVRASMRFSKTVQQTTRNISNNQTRYLNLSRDADTEQGSSTGDDEKDGMISYEMADKRIRSDDAVLYEVNLSEEQQYMLEQEPAISEDEDTDEGDQDKVSSGSDSFNSRQSAYGDKDCVGVDMPHLVSGNIFIYIHIYI